VCGEHDRNIGTEGVGATMQRAEVAGDDSHRYENDDRGRRPGE
jgi:hypothetical protein